MHETEPVALGQELRTKLFDLLNHVAVERRQVTLASGLSSNIYIDCRQIYFRGEAQFLIGELFFEQMTELECDGIRFDVCGGMAMGSIPLSCALSAAAFRRGRELSGFTVRKESKDHGMQAKIEGSKALFTDCHALMVEDVVTTAGSAIKAIEQLRAHNVKVEHLFAIVDREQGAKENLKAQGVTLHSLFTLSQFNEV